MAKPIAQRRHDEAERAFRKAWKLLDRMERRLERARAEERKRLAQLGDGTGSDASSRSAQLEAARAEIAQIEGLLTELSELITRNARASSGQTVKDMAHSVAAEIKDEAAEPPQLPTRSRNRHHRPRRKPATADPAAASAGGGAASGDAASSTGFDGSTPIELPPPLGVDSVEEPAAPARDPQSSSSRVPKPAPVVYRSLVSRPPGGHAPARTASDASGSDETTDAGGPDETTDPGAAGEAGAAEDAQRGADDPAPGADRDDLPVEGA